MADIPDYEFKECRTTQQRHDDEHRELQRLLNRLDASEIMPEEKQPAKKQQEAPKQHKVDKYGNYRYYDDSDEDPYYIEDAEE